MSDLPEIGSEFWARLSAGGIAFAMLAKPVVLPLARMVGRWWAEYRELRVEASLTRREQALTDRQSRFDASKDAFLERLDREVRALAERTERAEQGLSNCEAKHEEALETIRRQGIEIANLRQQVADLRTRCPNCPDLHGRAELTE